MPNQNPGEIGIDLRLKSDQVAKDIANASRIIKSGMASSVKGLGETSIEREDRIAAHKERVAKITRNRERKEISDKEYKEEVKARWDARRLRRKIAAEKYAAEISDAVEEASRRNKARRLWRERAERRKAAQQQGGGRLPVATMLAGLGLGVPGLGSVAALAQLNPASATLVATFRLLNFTLQTTIRASEDARRMYAKTLNSGLGTDLTVRRAKLAETIGVSEDMVWQYGAAVAALNSKLSHSSKIIADTNPALTATAWNFEILKNELGAMFAKLAIEAKPAIDNFINGMITLVRAISDNAERIGKIARALNPMMTAYKLFGGGGIGMLYKSLFGEKGALVNGQNNTVNEAPAPIAYMKQMKASQWERMGLVVGSGGGTDYARKTAENTQRTAAALQLLPEKIARAFAQFRNPNGYSLPAMP